MDQKDQKDSKDTIPRKVVSEPPPAPFHPQRINSQSSRLNSMSSVEEAEAQKEIENLSPALQRSQTILQDLMVSPFSKQRRPTLTKMPEKDEIPDYEQLII